MRKLNRSGFRVWSREDLRGALRGIDQANCAIASAIDLREMQLYRRGFRDALMALAETFAIDYIPTDHPVRSLEERVARCLALNTAN